MAFTVSRLGQTEASGDVYSLFYKQFTGEVLVNFDRINVMAPRTLVRTINVGKSATFGAIGKITGGYHAVGTDISTTAIKHNEKEILTDEKLYAAVLVSDIDELRSNYDVRAPYAHQMSQILAENYDKRLFQTAILGARTDAASQKIPDAEGGTVIAAGASVTTDADTLANAVFQLTTQYDINRIPEMERYLAVRPAQYHLLVQSKDAINKDWNDNNGSYAAAKIYQLGGFDLVKSNNIPSTDITAVTGENNTYAVDAQATVAVAWHKTALATVKQMDIRTESEWDIRKQGTIMLTKMVVGHGWLRPAALGEITNA